MQKLTISSLNHPKYNSWLYATAWHISSHHTYQPFLWDTPIFPSLGRRTQTNPDLDRRSTGSYEREYRKHSLFGVNHDRRNERDIHYQGIYFQTMCLPRPRSSHIFESLRFVVVVELEYQDRSQKIQLQLLGPLVDAGSPLARLWWWRMLRFPSWLGFEIEVGEVNSFKSRHRVGNYTLRRNDETQERHPIFQLPSTRDSV